MAILTGKERISRIFKRQPVDRIGLFESFWPETVTKWRNQGYLRQDESPEDHFCLDMRLIWPFQVMADLDYGEKVVDETAETRLVRNGNGALLRWWKDKAGTPENVDYMVKDRSVWQSHIRPHLADESCYRQRIAFEAYRQVKQHCHSKNLFFCWSGLNVFECMHRVCGHENMLAGMALDPGWIKDMCGVYAELAIDLMDILFAEQGKPDGIWFYEDMGFKDKPFMSPAMYRDIVMPAHKRTFDYAHSIGLPVILHSCGFVEPLVPSLVEAGMDCLQAIEVKAGMDLLRLKQQYADKLTFMGGMDIRTLVTNKRDAVRAELEKKLPAAIAGGGYVLHSDHSIPDQVEYETYRFFTEYGLKLGTSPVSSLGSFNSCS